jgi:hypothetical protein
MKRLAATLFVTWVTITLFCVFAVTIGCASPIENQIVGLQMCEDVLCYQGIVPLKTTYDKAQSIISHIPGAHIDPIVHDISRISQGPIELVNLFRGTGTDLREIDVHPRENVVTLAQFILSLGPPCGVYPSYPSNRYPFLITIHYPTVSLWIETDHWQLQPNSAVKEIDLIPPALESIAASNNRLISPCSRPDKVVRYDWRGFSQYPNQKP